MGTQTRPSPAGEVTVSLDAYIAASASPGRSSPSASNTSPSPNPSSAGLSPGGSPLQERQPRAAAPSAAGAGARPHPGPERRRQHAHRRRRRGRTFPRHHAVPRAQLDSQCASPAAGARAKRRARIRFASALARGAHPPSSGGGPGRGGPGRGAHGHAPVRAPTVRPGKAPG